MNEKSAKVMTVVGISSCLTALILSGFILSGHSELPVFVSFFLLIAGILILVFSLAYYTEK